jgi:hypothetical protein
VKESKEAIKKQRFYQQQNCPNKRVENIVNEDVGSFKKK